MTAPRIEAIADILAIAVIILRFAIPILINRGAENRALVSAKIRPVPLTKSILNGVKAVARGTNNTPPPKPERGAMQPIMKVAEKRITGHTHQHKEGFGTVIPSSAIHKLV
jgi:hypothetical protein